MKRSATDKSRLVHRLKIARGHLNKVITMVENDEYCIDVLHQSQAVQQALRNADTALIQHHLSHCMHEAIAKGEQQQTIEEFMTIIKKRG